MYFSRLSYSRASGWIKVDEITDRCVVCDYVVGHLLVEQVVLQTLCRLLRFFVRDITLVYDTSSSVIYSTVSILSFATLSFVLPSRLHPNVLFRLNGSSVYVCETFNVKHRD